MGYDGIELRFLADQRDLLKAPELQKEMLPLTKQQLKEARVAVCCVDTSVLLVQEDEAMMEAGRLHIDLAAELSAPFVRVFGGRIPEGTSRSAAMQTAAKNFLRLAEYAGGKRVDVLVETHDDFSTSESVAELIRRTNHPSAGVLWDIHHPFRFHGETPAQAFAAIGPHVKHVHVKDSILLGEGKFRYCLLGEGDVPVAQCLNLLKTAGYNGWIVLEWEKTWHPELEEPEVVFPHFIEKINKVT